MNNPKIIRLLQQERDDLLQAADELLADAERLRQEAIRIENAIDILFGKVQQDTAAHQCKYCDRVAKSAAGLSAHERSHKKKGG